MKIILVISFIIFVGCNSVNKETDDSVEILDKFYGKSLILPKNVISYLTEDYSFIDSAKIYQAPLKIVTLIDGSCSSCVLQLKEWNEFIKQYQQKSSEISFLIFIESNSGFETFRWIVEKEKVIQYPVFLDLHNELSKLNQLPTDKIFWTFLINKSNEIILVGNPNSSKEMKKLYCKVLDEYQ